MSAQMIIFIDDKNLTAFDISSGQVEALSFDGRNKLPCTGASTADKLANYINYNYNYEDIDSNEILIGKIQL